MIHTQSSVCSQSRDGHLHSFNRTHEVHYYSRSSYFWCCAILHGFNDGDYLVPAVIEKCCKVLW